MSDVQIVLPVGALGASDFDSALDTVLRTIAVRASSDPEGEWAEKYGTDFENDEFMMHHFCWCERGDCRWCSEDACGCEHQMPAPNFWHKPSGFKVWWYKYIGRSQETVGSCDWPAAERDCLAAISAGGHADPL